jgi:CHAT domain-containing protein
LVVATNGALGLLPLGLLPVTPVKIEARADLAFSEYRSVPWLARTHAVTVVPSAAALRMLRQLPAASDKRETFIGFGDPLFSKEQEATAERSVVETETTQVASVADMRGLPLRRRATAETQGIDSADLATLPRLPDTADELRSVALALEIDPAKALNLRRQANERKVKTTDLSRYRIIAFATHGLVPGALNGLAEPALALTAPSVADIDGDGLLTMSEILALRLDADWVILSACNTGAGAGAGAEAASGLGRAFFYAGSRALLVTNWSVHSASARDLVSDLFRRQAESGKTSRAQALQKAMLALMDGLGFQDAAGGTLFSYAHPLFWAPFTLIGDSS